MNSNQIYQVVKALNSGTSIESIDLRAVDYVRVSTASEDQRKSFQNQIDTYEQMIQKNSHWTYVKTYADRGISGTTANRDEFQSMISDAENGLFDLIVVKDVARFARNIKECLVYRDRLKDAGVIIYFVKENLVTFRQRDEQTFQLMAMVAAMEAESAQTRTKIVFDQGIQNGKVYGNSKILGYTKNHCSLVIDPQEAEIVRSIFDMYVHEKCGLRRIAKRLAESGATRTDGGYIAIRTIQTVLANPKYKGFYCGGKTEKIKLGDRNVRRYLPEDEWVMYPDPNIPVIVPPELWDEAEKIRKERSKEYSETVGVACNIGKYRYSGKIISELADGVGYTRCGYKYKGVFREAWQCRNHRDMKNPSNVGPTLYSDELDEIVKKVIDALLGDYDKLIENLIARYAEAFKNSDSNKRVTQIEKSLFKYKQKESKLLELFENGAISLDEFKERKAVHESEKQKLMAEHAELLSADEYQKKWEDQLWLLKDRLKELAVQTVPSKETIDSIIEKIVVKKESDKKNVRLDIILRGVEKPYLFSINRGKNRDFSCVCCNRVISMSASRTLPS